MDKKKIIYCTNCGAHLGEAVIGYMKTVQCFCGEVIPIKMDTIPFSKNFENNTIKPLLAY